MFVACALFMCVVVGCCCVLMFVVAFVVGVCRCCFLLVLVLSVVYCLLVFVLVVVVRCSLSFGDRCCSLLFVFIGCFSRLL